MLTTGKGTHYCKHCGFDMKAKEERDCQACDGDMCEPRNREPKKPKLPHDVRECVRKANAALAASGVRIVQPVMLQMKGSTANRSDQVALEALPGAKRANLRWLMTEFCPFCGERTQEKERGSVELAECEGIEGPCLYLNNYRIVGPKPWGGGRIVWRWRVSIKDIREALKRPMPTGGGE